MLTYTLVVVEKTNQTKDSVTLCFKQPTFKKIQYVAGQYLSLIFKINGRKYIRPYSFSSCPGVDSYLEITIKRVQGGVVSNHIFDTIQVGDAIEVTKPMGDFIIPQALWKEDNNFVLWAAGSGITPLFSIAKSVLFNSSAHHVTLVYGNRSGDSIIFKQKIQDIQAQFANRFAVWHFHTKSVVAAHPYLIQGRIDPKKILTVINEERDIKNTIHYICGPNGLKQIVKQSLAAFNIPEEHIFSEDFELVKDEKDFHNIITQQVGILTNGINKIVEVVRGKSILEAALDASIDIPYSCQTGDCSICKGKLLKGKVKQIIIKHPDLSEDEYQLCCTYPLSLDVEIAV